MTDESSLPAEEEQIERDAAALLAEYAQRRSIVDRAADPHRGYRREAFEDFGIEFDDMHKRLGVPRSGRLDPDILGAICFDERRIVIDESLDPEENPAKEGRYRFTLAHEGGGHWRLHRHLFAKDPAQSCLVRRAGDRRSVVCRSSQAKEPMEWQADFYASCLLMPRKLVFAAWDEDVPGSQAARSPTCGPSTSHHSSKSTSRASAESADLDCSETRRHMRSTASLGHFAERFPRFADGHAHPTGEAGVAASRSSASARFSAAADSPFFEENVKCQLDR